MKISKKATSIAEAIIVTLIIAMWLTWVYKIFIQSIKLTDNIENKIQAIQIAREWIEAATNIRNTNWILFPWYTENCWTTVNYDSTCLTTWPSLVDSSTKIYKDSDFRWKTLSSSLTTDYSDVNYRDFFKVWLASNWTYTQSGSEIVTELNTFFTREIKTESIESITWDVSTLFDWLKVTSIVQRKDPSSEEIRKLEIESILTNYKK